MSAPERIWAYETPDGDTGWLSDPTPGQATGSTEYVRADVAASQLAEAQAEAERWAAQALKEEECRITWQAERDRLAAELARKDADIARLTLAVEFAARWAWRTDPPNANNKLTDAERLSAIKYHPTIKEYGEPHRELADSEAIRAMGEKK